MYCFCVKISIAQRGTSCAIKKINRSLPLQKIEVKNEKIDSNSGPDFGTHVVRK
jgi:hypothetical protein